MSAPESPKSFAARASAAGAPGDPVLATTLRRLREAAREQARPTSPADGPLPLRWEECSAIRTGPQTFRITVPVAGPAPARAVETLLRRIRERCAQAGPPRGDGSVRAVYGRAEEITPTRGYLSMFITTTGAGDDGPAEAARLCGLVRKAARGDVPPAEHGCSLGATRG